MAYEHKVNTGSLFLNEYKEDGDKKPDFRGKGNIDGVVKDISVWVNRNDDGSVKNLSVKFQEEYKKPDAAPAPQQQVGI